MTKNSANCWICDNVYVKGNVKVKGHCHTTRKYRSSAYKDCDIKVKLNKKLPVIFCNLKNYDSHLIMQELGKFSFKINIILNGLEKYVNFNISNKSFFIDSFQFLCFSLDVLVKNLGKDDFKCLNQEFDSNILNLVRHKGFYPYEYMSGFEKFGEKL